MPHPLGLYTRPAAASGGGAPTPPVAGPTLWYDFSDTSSLTVSGGTCSQANDLSGNAYHLTQGTGANQPASGSRTINSLNVLDFDGTNDYMANNSFAFSVNTHSLFVVVLWDTAAAQGGIASVSGSSSGNDYDSATVARLLFGYPTDNAFQNYYNGATRGSTDLGDPRGTAHQISSQRNGAAWDIWQDNTAGTSRSDATTSLSVSSLFIGADHAGGAVEFFNGAIGEVLLYPTYLGTTDRETVQTYLKNKWATP